MLRLPALKHCLKSVTSQPIPALASCKLQQRERPAIARPRAKEISSARGREATQEIRDAGGQPQTYHCSCRREMALCITPFALLLRKRERLCSIMKASAMMLSTVSVNRVVSNASCAIEFITPLQQARVVYCLFVIGRSRIYIACFWHRASVHDAVWGRDFDVLISMLEHVVRTLDSTRTYSMHLTADS
jgi:hypothetical protein